MTAICCAPTSGRVWSWPALSRPGPSRDALCRCRLRGLPSLRSLPQTQLSTEREDSAAGTARPRSIPGHKARRWVVERTHSWLNRFRKLLVSFEKTEASYTALLSLAAALICWRQTITIYG